MSSSTSTLTFIAQQAAIYLGIPLLVGGVIGGLLNTIVFVSLKTFRESSCAFYLIIMSITNVGQLLLGLLSRIMISGFEIDWTQSSSFYCKFRVYFLQLCALVSMTCYCLVTIDQYFATCSRPRWQQWCNIKMAQRLCIISILFWLLHGIPYVLYYDMIVSTTTGKSSCTITNLIFSRYISICYQSILGSSLPIFITGLFGFLAHHNVQQLNYRTVPLVRRELDKQLTRMVLVQVIINFICIIPYFIILMIPPSDNGVMLISLGYINVFTILLYYVYYVNPFFVYICTSERFRRQVVYVLFEIYFNRWQRQRMGINQVRPQV